MRDPERVARSEHGRYARRSSGHSPSGDGHDSEVSSVSENLNFSTKLFALQLHLSSLAHLGTCSCMRAIKMSDTVRRRSKNATSRFRRILFVALLVYFVLRLLLLLLLPPRAGPTRLETHADSQVARDTFLIVVLTMDRSDQLSRLLHSLQSTNFHGSSVRLDIHIDDSTENARVSSIANRFRFSHGQKRVHKLASNRGLKLSWIGACCSSDWNEKFIILEDDIILSPHWFTWLMAMWKNYGDENNLAGISLQRQTLIPKGLGRTEEIVNEHQPFMYRLVGSIGFSPKLSIWKEFIQWVKALDNNFDVSTPGLVTSKWWNKLDKRNMWTQHFIYFCLQRDLYTLYQNLPNKVTFAAHERAQGAHFKKTLGLDFLPSRYLPSIQNLKPLKRFDWDGHEVNDRQGFDDITLNTMLHRAQIISANIGFVYVMFINKAFVNMGKSWICNIRSMNASVLDNVLVIVDGSDTLHELASIDSNIHYFIYKSKFKHKADFGTYLYYRIVLERLFVQNMILQSGSSTMIIESDQTWFSDITNVISSKFRSGFAIVAGDERSHLPNKTQSYICGGFYGIASTSETKIFFDNYVRIHNISLSRYENSTRKIGIENDQALLSRLVQSENMNVHWFDACEYTNGIWYTSETFRRSCMSPIILHNNYVVGNLAKEERAKQLGHWFVSGDMCTL